MKMKKKTSYITNKDMFVQICISVSCNEINKEKALHFIEDILSKDIWQSIKKGIYNIGLIIARRLIELHSGFIDIETDIKGDCKFKIYIPKENTFS